MNTRIRTIAAAFTLLAVLLAGVTAHADPLPAPAAPQAAPDSVVIAVVNLLAPDPGEEATYNTVLTWGYPLGADKFVVKMVVAGSGQVVKHKVMPDACKEGVCTLTLGATALFDHVEDGELFTWRVIAKHDGSASKSVARAQTANTVQAPETLFPGTGANLLPIHMLTWEHSPANKSYRLVIKEDSSGTVAFKHKVPATDCNDVCAVNPYDGWPMYGSTIYRWFVKTKGFNGDTEKSHQQTFVSPNQVALR